MTEPQKRSLNAKEIVADIRAGMSDAELQEKYRLTKAGLHKVVAKLMAAGALSAKPKPPPRERAPAQAPESPDPPAVDAQYQFARPKTAAQQDLWTCPSCAFPQPRPETECARCGLVIAKASSHPADSPMAPLYRPPGYGDDEPQEEQSVNYGMWILGGIAVLLVALVLTMFLRQGGFRGTNRAALGPGDVQYIVGKTFESQVQQQSMSMPVLIMFYADW